MFAPEIETSRDRETGIPIAQVTNDASINHPTYFLQSSFFPDGRSMVFTSYRTGTPQMFEARYPSGEIRQLTDGPAIHAFSPAIHPSGDVVYFVRGGSIRLLSMPSLEEDVVIEFPDAQLGECSLSADGDWLTAAIRISGRHGVAVGRANGTGWHVIPFERTVIHPQFHPLEPEWLIFAGDPAPRMHRVRRDGSGLECLYRHGNDEFVVHETFLGKTGDIVFTVWPRELRRMDWTTRSMSTVAEINAWHITPNRAGTQVLFDTNHPDRGICLIGVATGKIQTVCRPDASNGGSQWKKSSYALAEDFAAATRESLSWMESPVDTVYGPQWTHPHPSFSPDESRIAFASDRTGWTQVYVAELGV